LLEIPNVTAKSTRDGLTFTLPNSILVGLGRPQEPSADLTSILVACEQWGLLDDGRWATDILLRNAIRATRGSRLEPLLERYRRKFELAADTSSLSAQPEIVTGEIDWIMPVRFLSLGAQRARAVARLRVSRFFEGKPDVDKGKQRSGHGTGWLITPTLLMTNEHVLNARFESDPSQQASDSDRALQALGTVAWFGYTDELSDEHSAYQAAKLEACDRRLDYAVLRVAPDDTKHGIPLADWGSLSLEKPAVRPKNGDPLNIIHHPGGDPQCVTLRRNDFIRDLGKDGRFHYLTDTRPGSSGSPVFNDDWRVIGLHRAGVLAEKPGKIKGEKITYNNEGVWMSDILAHLTESLRSEIRAYQPLYTEG
jgi:V8-like Glu-specific endopeptidase